MNNPDPPAVWPLHTARIDGEIPTTTTDSVWIPDHERKPIARGSEDPLDHGSGIGLWAIKWGVEQLDGEVEFTENGTPGSVVKLYLGDMN